LRGITRQTSLRAAGVEEALQQLAFVKGRLQGRGQLLELVNTLAIHSPEGIQWDSLTFTQGDGLALKGISEALPDVYEFVAGLDGEPAFGQVEARRVAKGKAGEEDVTTFEIACPLAGATGAP
jgi:Tfp pilus assembly protein PilN